MFWTNVSLSTFMYMYIQQMFYIVSCFAVKYAICLHLIKLKMTFIIL